MARKEIKIFMDAKEAASFLKTIDWSWLFGFLSERYNVSLSPHKELKDNGAAIIKVEWPDELIEKCGMMADVFSSVKLVTFDSYFKRKSWNTMKISSMKNVKHGLPIQQRRSAISIAMASSRNGLLR